MASTIRSKNVVSTPYTPGVALRIRRHIAPVPFGSGYGPSPRPKVRIVQSEKPLDRVAFALDKPPTETAPPPPGEEEQHTFTITGQKTLRRFGVVGGGAHVVTGYIDQDKAARYVAKIYDGVYYPLMDPDSGEDCMLLADADYAVEYWAYETMQPVDTVAGRLVPACYGGWTFALATNQPGRRRWVRMLLLQLVDGESMLAKIARATKNDVVRYSLLPREEFRLGVLKSLIEADIAIWWDAEVLHMDQNPRNIMVQDDGSVVFVDFNQAHVYRFIKWERHPKYEKDAPKLPVSPIERYWPFAPGGTNLADTAECENPWANWIPESWLKNKELAAEWVLETWKDASPNRYRPLSSYFLNHWDHLERAPRVLAMLERLGRKPAVKH